MNRFAVLLPVAIFAALAGIFALQLWRGGATTDLPSALIDRPAPQFELPPLEGMDLPGVATADLATGKPTIVNIWASWCGPCRVEHPVLMELAKRDDVAIVGIDYKDTPANARRFLGALGNPFSRVGVDPKGRTAIEWGFYGVPETFLVDGEGIVRHKIVGPIGAAQYEELVAKIEAL